ncbi:cation transporter [Methyloligella halotolerans]|uniref:cation transporter n=1 Tax=Methyloligella halotolerans TaxID=1177755 RepID=UPI001FD8E2E1|nr:cation transporter [Methyloligella halotolerans]
MALAVNLAMFVVELTAGLLSGSVSLLADGIDFAGDAANYAISLAVVGLALHWRARTALLKGVTMAAFGLWVIGQAIWHWVSGVVPDAPVMGVVGVMALAANAGVAAMLYRYREGDSNMRSVWICSRNDAYSNLAVLAAAAGVFGTGSSLPDIAVACVMAGLALHGSYTVIRHAVSELRHSSPERNPTAQEEPAG